MTIILKERSGETLRVSRVPAETVAELRAMLPASVELTELPDADVVICESCDWPLTAGDRHAGTCPNCLGTLPREPWMTPKPAGYFGLAVALARKTWGG